MRGSLVFRVAAKESLRGWWGTNRLRAAARGIAIPLFVCARDSGEAGLESRLTVRRLPVGER
jgi:hypothetical protein